MLTMHCTAAVLKVDSINKLKKTFLRYTLKSDFLRHKRGHEQVRCICNIEQLEKPLFFVTWLMVTKKVFEYLKT